MGDAITALKDQLKNIPSNQRESPSVERRTMNETRSRTLHEQSCVSRQRNMTKHEQLDKKLFNEVEQKNIEITSYSFLEFQPRLQF